MALRYLLTSAQIVFLIATTVVTFMSIHRQRPYLPDIQKRGGGGGVGGACFSGHDTVQQILPGSNISVPCEMRNLKSMSPDTKIAVCDNQWKTSAANLDFWIHHDHERELEFIRITFEDQKTLDISDRHLIYVTDCQITVPEASILARKVKLGDCLLKMNEKTGVMEQTMVTNLSKVKSKGVYAPLTTTGNLFVNGVLVSCFSDVESELLQKILYSYAIRAIRFLENFGYCEMTTTLPAVTNFLDLAAVFVS